MPSDDAASNQPSGHRPGNPPDAADTTRPGSPSHGPDPTDDVRLQVTLRQAQKMEAIGLLVAGVTHDVNDSFASILAFSHLIRTDVDLPPQLRDQADLLIDEAQRLHRKVQAILDFARQRPPARQPTRLREIVDQVLVLQAYALGPSRIEALVDIPDDIPALPIDRAQILQVLVSLIIDAVEAIRATSERGSIRIVASRAATAGGDEVVQLSISHDAPGIQPELRLGLAESSGIVAANGGTLRHEAGSDGVGATFILELPIRESIEPTRTGSWPDEPGTIAADRRPAGLPVLTDLTDPTRSIASRPPSGPRVLVIDDDALILDYMVRILSRGGYDPIAAIDGPAALEIIRSEPPRAILCDQRMAGMSGIAFHDAVAAIDTGLARRFAFMSGDVLSKELHDYALNRGIVVLAKPFDMDALSRTVAQMVAGD